jgi:hypothetical protein
MFLLLFATPVQRNDPAILSQSIDRCPAALIWGSPLGGNICGLSNLGEFVLVSIQPSELFHSLLDRVRMYGVGRIVRHLGQSPVAELILPFAV